MNIKSDVEILRNLFETSIDQIPEIYEKCETLRIPFDEKYTDSEIQELTNGKKQITETWVQAELLMFLIETVKEEAKSVKKTFHSNTDDFLRQLYQTLKNESTQHRKTKVFIKNQGYFEKLVVIKELTRLNKLLSTLPSSEKNTRFLLEKRDFGALLGIMTVMGENKDSFNSMPTNDLFSISKLLEDISNECRNKKVTFPLNMEKLFKDTEIKVTKSLNARLPLLKEEFRKKSDELKELEEKIMSLPK